MDGNGRGITALFGAALALAACTGGRAPLTPSTARRSPAANEGQSAASGASSEGRATGLRRALEQSLAGVPRDSLRLRTECRRDGGMAALELYGRGIAILDGERQLRLEPERIDAAIRVLLAADFPGLEESYGGGGPDDDDMAILVACGISLSLAGLEKEVTQLAKGEQSETVWKLADDLFAIARTAVGPAVMTSGLRDGLEKIARGELEPESWSVTLHRSPEAPPGGAEASGFLLVISGRAASVRLREAGSGGYAPPRTIELPPEEIRRAARALAALDPAAWPVNLYSSGYIDLSISVLNRRQSVQAQQFGGLTPTARGESQLAFEAAVDLLAGVEREVLARAASQPTPGSRSSH